jgi:hypothetical protein
VDRYTDGQGRERELVCRPGAGGSTLVVDRACGAPRDERLVAHLDADEPAENASLVASLYLADDQGRYCRALTPRDFLTTPFASDATRESHGPESRFDEAELVDKHGRSYQLALARSVTSMLELRWHCHPPLGTHGCPELITLRAVIGRLESYEPARTLTARALTAHRGERSVSLTVVRAEFDRMLATRVVLNRGLREAVLTAVQRQGLSMSEIAARCGRVKRDVRGNESGETGWLARRLGILPEGGADAPTPWVCSDVLALIARRGLDLAPLEVEL